MMQPSLALPLLLLSAVAIAMVAFAVNFGGAGWVVGTGLALTIGELVASADRRGTTAS